MKITGIAAEYNPFHLGHAYHLFASRGDDPDTAVAAVMSGDFVQRGEAAVYSKYARAEAACRCGADLVVELPLEWGLSSAEGFARGCVRILAGLGAGSIAFGTEAGALSGLEEIADVLTQEGFAERIRDRLREDPRQSYAAARQQLAEETLGRPLPEMRQANNILAIEYLKAVRELEPGLSPVAVQRVGAAHDGARRDGYASAMELRRLLREGRSIDAWIPAEAAEVFRREREAGREVSDVELYERLLLARLRMLRCEDFCAHPDAGGGLGEKLFHAVRTAGCMEEILQEAAGKRFSLARIRRILLCAALGVQPAAREQLPQTARILAFNDKGREILRNAQGIRLLTKTGDSGKLDPESRKQVKTAADAHDFYVLLYPHGAPWACGEDWQKGPVIL